MVVIRRHFSAGHGVHGRHTGPQAIPAADRGFSRRKSKTKLSDDSTVTASIGPRDAGEGFGIAVGLEIGLPGLSRAQAEELVAKAHIVCPYSHATRGNIDVRLSVV